MSQKGNEIECKYGYISDSSTTDRETVIVLTA